MFIFSGYKKIALVTSFVFVIHEIGHIISCKIFNIKIDKINITPFGGCIKINSNLNMPIFSELIISSAGILFQLLLYLLNLFFLKSNLLEKINLEILLLNILPIIPFDGSKIFFCIISNFFSYKNSYKIFYFLSVLSSITVIIYFYNKSNFNVALLMYIFLSFIKEVRLCEYKINKFLLERYIYNFHHDKSIKHNNCDVYKMHRNKDNYFYECGWIDEKKALSKKFDNNSYF